MEKEPIACRVDPALIKKLDDSAAKDSRSRAGQLEFILRAVLSGSKPAISTGK